MSKQYSCDLCKKVFNQKIDFTRHQNKKVPCITLTEMQQISQTKEVKTEFKTNLSTIFNYCLDVLNILNHILVYLFLHLIYVHYIIYLYSYYHF